MFVRYGLEKTDNKTAGNEGCYKSSLGTTRGICTNQYDCILAKCLDFYRNCSFTMIKMHMVLCILQKQTKMLGCYLVKSNILHDTKNVLVLKTIKSQLRLFRSNYDVISLAPTVPHIYVKRFLLKCSFFR